MRFEEAYEGWNEERLTQGEVARLLGVCERSFRRYVVRFEADGLEGLIDRRLEQVSHRRAPVDEVMALTDRYRTQHAEWNVKHFHSWYRRAGGTRGYTWVKKRLQEASLVEKGRMLGAHRRRRERSPLPGMMVHQDGSTHAWVPDALWDLIVTMDDATNEHYAMAFVAEEGTASSFQGVGEVIESRGLFSSFYSDRGSHYWRTPEAGGKVDKDHPTQFGRAMKQLGIEMIAAYSPEARGRSERAFGTHQGRLPQELQLADILCEQFERTVGNDNCVRFEGLSLQIPAAEHRCHFVKAKVRVHRYPEGRLALFHGPRRLARYEPEGDPVAEPALKAVA